MWTHQCWPTSKNLNTSAVCRHWMLPKGLTKSNDLIGINVRSKLRESVLSACLDDDDDDDDACSKKSSNLTIRTI